MRVDDPTFSIDFHVRHTALPKRTSRDRLNAFSITSDFGGTKGLEHISDGISRAVAELLT